MTLFERMQTSYSATVGTMLTEQYRMNSNIMQWSSTEMYKSKLKAHPSVANHTLADLSGVDKDATNTIPILLLIDTAGCDHEEEIGEDGVSRANPGEAEVSS